MTDAEALEVEVVRESELKLEPIQGHLLGALAEMETHKLEPEIIDKVGIPWRQQLRIFNHTIVPKSMELAAVMIPWFEYNGTIGRLYALFTVHGAWVKSREHDEKELPSGWYILFHRYPGKTTD